jgi:hypothetical protein
MTADPDEPFLSPHDPEDREDECRSIGTFPEGALTWAHLFSRPVRFGVWPYTDEQAQAILTCLPDRTQFDTVLLEARRYKRLLQGRGETNRPNPRNELIGLLKSIGALRARLQSLSDSAERHLVEQIEGLLTRRYPDKSQRNAIATGKVVESRVDLGWALDRFHRDNSRAFESLPPMSRGGARRRNAESLLLCELEKTWIKAHHGKRPARGWPKFRDACALPLGVPGRSEKAWQEALLKCRENLGKKR